MANIVLKCPVCGAALADDICPQCGYVHLYFPTSVPKAIDEFQKNRIDTLRTVGKRHSEEVDAVNHNLAAARQQAERLRADLSRANDTIKSQKEELDIQKGELDAKDKDLRRMEREIAELRNRLREAESRPTAPQLPFGFTVSPEGDFIGSLNDRGERTMGVSRNSNGEFYMGDWKLDLMTGVGVRWERNGRKYAGQFRMDRAHGVGVMVNPDGNGFAGEWKSGKRYGAGMTSKPNGEKMFARYDGEIIGTASGAYFLQDGSIVCGRMTELGPTGRCICYRPDGSVEYETWRNGVKI